MRDLLKYILKSKKYWMFPLIILLLIFSIFTILQSSVIAPFIYTLF
ncbi:MAG: DUF5989 family protein [Bacteroidota bacterium]|nr:DUF5989 family protein [Bacteroidota bacterium]